WIGGQSMGWPRKHGTRYRSFMRRRHTLPPWPATGDCDRRSRLVRLVGAAVLASPACRVLPMNDPIPWSFPLPGRPFGITVKVHLLFPIVAVGLIVRTAFQQGAVPGVWQDATWVMIVLLLSVLLHEFGHCAGARLVYGDAAEILIWPLGGLASIDVPTAW